jgi:hypothetical protein
MFNLFNDNSLGKYYMTPLPGPQGPEVLRAIKASIKEAFPNGPAIAKTVVPDVDLSVKDRMKHIGKEIIKLRKRK